MKKFTSLLLLFSCGAFAQIVNTAPYILTIAELKNWTIDGATASPDLISTVPLAQRFTNTETQFNPNLSNEMQIAYLPDGMNNFGNYFGEQNQFNLYNFTHWASIDKLVWFGGTASQAIQIPSSPWANAAHKNGVKIFGNIFFAPSVFGGSSATLQTFLEQDDAGNFVVIPKLVAIMQYYNFDGWFINQETATTPAVAVLMQKFVKDLTAQAEPLNKEVMWYDSMRLNGAVGWQNRLNVNNSPFVQDDQDGDGTFESRVSSSIFINFFWGSSAFPTMSRTRALAIGRSQFEVFTGADIWPGRNQGNFETNGNSFMANLHENATTPITSLGLFAPNCVFNNSAFTNFNNDPNDYESFYLAEQHMFAGADNNPATVDATAFKGFSNWIPESSVITGSFYTSFNTGHGLKRFSTGEITSAQGWHNMNEQDILPTWQWAFSQNNLLTAKWDFEDAYIGGSSLKVTGSLAANSPVDLMLYKTKIPVGSNNASTNISFAIKTENPFDSTMKLILVFSDEIDQKYEFELSGNFDINGWRYTQAQLQNFNGREIAMIGFRFNSETALTNYSVNIGEMVISDVILATVNSAKDNTSVIVSYPRENVIDFTINLPGTSKVNFALFDLQGKMIKSDVIQLNKKTNYQLNTSGLAAGTYFAKITNKNTVSETRKIIVK